nr:hypothetical protein [Polyangiaceae bacterium]
GGGGGTGGGTSLPVSFFVTSTGSGPAGGNLGGIQGADAKCQALASAAGAGAATWRAYLSTTTEDARDRIGSGPWFNFAGDMVASSVASLHTNGISNGVPQHMMDQNGNAIPAKEHDILTGSLPNGTKDIGGTCADWTSGAFAVHATVGHTDIPNPPFSPSWNSAHRTLGCTQNSFQNPNGAGRLYCFAL